MSRKKIKTKAPIEVDGLRIRSGENTENIKKLKRKQRDDGVLYRSVLDSLSDIMAIINNEGTIVNVNKAWKLFAKENNAPEDVYKGVGLNYLEVLRNVSDKESDIAQQCLSGIQAIIKGIRPSFEMEYTCHSSTEKRWFLVRALPLYKSKCEIIISYIDITDLKKTEYIVRESEATYRTLYIDQPSMYFTLDCKGKIISANQFGAYNLGYKIKELIGQNILKVFHKKDHQNILEQFNNCMENLNQVYRAECRKVRKDGSVLWVEEFLRAIPAHDGSVNILVVCHDITEHIQARENLKSAFSVITKLKNQLQQENIYLQKEIEINRHYGEIYGRSNGIKEVLRRVDQVAQTDTSVLLLGETGTGKELIAEAIHRHSLRKNRIMVKVNCAALPPSIIESELFGREKGAYTGALTKGIGRFELADESTLFLDEIGELPLELQSKLLRIIEEGEFERLGSSKTIRVNVRIITATNQDLSKAVEIGNFREDLYYRLNVFPISIPPLRDRSVDIPQLVWAFVNEFNKSMGKRVESISKKSMDELQRYSWPGNIRELRNVIERAMIICEGKILKVDLPGIPDSILHKSQKLIDVERNHILKILRKTEGRVYGKNGAAEILGLKPTTLYSRMNRLGIKRPRNSNDI